MNVNDIYGRIGAAKAFSSSVSNSLDLDLEMGNSKVESISQQIQSETDPKKKAKLEKKKKALQKKNKALLAIKKANKGTTDFLTKIMSYIDISINMVIEFISNVIVFSIPILEVSVKMLLISNIKKMLCSIDPRIPDEWRDNGVIINDAMIDPRHVLSVSPYTRMGKKMYFGVNQSSESEDESSYNNIYELARAEDMNAFMWFAKNCAKFVSPNIINNTSQFFDASSDSTFYNTHEFKGKSEYRYLEGSSFKHDSNASTMFLCEKRYFVDEGANNGTYYTILPVSDSWTGINWYKDRTSITGFESKKNTNYDKSKPLFNIEYSNQYNPQFLPSENNFRFRILPKPFSTAGGFITSLESNISQMADSYLGGVEEVIGEEIVNNIPNFKFEGIQSPIPYYARFNQNGIYDKKGRFSINTRKYKVVYDYLENNHIYYNIVQGSTKVAILRFSKSDKKFTLLDNSKDPINNVYERMALLTECYTGWTIYEFNYDYVTSLKLFDEKSIAAGIVESLLNLDFNAINFSGSDSNGSVKDIEQIRIDSYIDKLVENMIDNEEKEFTDCFYTFSNEDYEEMEMNVVRKINNSTLTTDRDNIVNQIYDILSSYDADASLNTRTETISLALKKAAQASGFDYTSNKYANEVSYYPMTQENQSVDGFIKKMVKFLTSSVVNSILTPKVLLLLQVNRMMMGTYDINKYKEITVEAILNDLRGLLSDLIREIVDFIQKEILRMILERLSVIIASYMKKLGIEYAMKWVNLIKMIISCIPFPSGGNNIYNNSDMNDLRGSISSIIDNVDYADIDKSIDEIMPKTNPC